MDADPPGEDADDFARHTAVDGLGDGRYAATIDEVWKPIDDVIAQNKINPVVEGYCLTADQNIVQAKLVAKYRISDPIRFRLAMKDPEGILHDTVLAALTQTVGSWKVNDVLRLQRGGEEGAGGMESLAGVVNRRAQERLDELDCGMEISALEFKEIHPPRHVVAAFRDVQNARIETETKKREAEGFVLGKIPAAEAEANRMIKAATAYHSTLNARATAELSVFEQVYAEYRNNPGVVRQRILMESLEDVLANVGRRIYLPLGSRVILPPPAEVQRYLPWHKRRLEVAPGLTGLWQVSGRSELTFDEMVLLDLYYIENWSPLLDLQIMLRTVPKLITGEGAY